MKLDDSSFSKRPTFATSCAFWLRLTRVLLSRVQSFALQLAFSPFRPVGFRGVCSLTTAVLLIGWYVPALTQNTTLHKGLLELVARGFAYRFVDDNTLEIHQESFGFKRIKSLRKPDEQAIQAWIQSCGIPTLEIDPASIDTSQYSGWYSYWTEVPLSNGPGTPLIAGDLDRNGMWDFYGIFKDFTSESMARAYELDSNGVVTLLHTYSPRVFAARHAVDVDGDSLWEVMFDSCKSEFSFQQTSRDSVPNSLKFGYRMWESSCVFNRHYVGDLDGDESVDFLYRGDQLDTLCGSTACEKTYVAEYNTSIGTFERVSSIQWWTDRIGGDYAVQGYAVGDFDSDNHKEFVASSIWGNLFVGENVGDNDYTEVWRDSLAYVNMYYQTSGDVDGDGQIEFFVGATMSSGYWLTVFEADSDNSYSARFLFHILAGGTFDEPTNLTSDVDGDGRLELVLLSGGYVLIFKSGGNDSYYLWYFKALTFGWAIGTRDLNGDGKQDLIITGDEVNQTGRRFRAEVYLASFTVSVSSDLLEGPSDYQLNQNYPNPFNSKTQIRFTLPERCKVQLEVFSIVGEKVGTVVNGIHESGEHTITFDGHHLASGLYFYRMKAGHFLQWGKMILLR